MTARELSPAARPHRNLGLTAGGQWALLLAASLAAWFLWPSPRPTPPAPFDERGNRDGFLAVVYGGIRPRPTGHAISPELFREHLEALASAGYRPISLEDAERFLREGVPLPEKAVLLTFDDGRRDTARYAEEALLERRFPATFLLRLEPIEESQHFFATWHALRSLARTARWSFGAKGVRSFDRVRTDTDGSSGLFLTSRALLPAEGRSETDAEWERRVREEIASSERILRERIPGWKPVLFAFPCSDGGQSMEDGGERLREAVSATFPLAFARTGYAFNHWRIDRSQLTRLVVSPGWTGDDLVRRLDAQGSRRAAYTGGDDLDWVLRHGTVVSSEDHLTLAAGEGQGAEAWLAGTEHWRCVQGRLTLETRPETQAWLYLRAIPGKSFVRLGWNGRRIEVQVRIDGGEVQVLARAAIPQESARAVLSFDLTERRIRFSLDCGTAPERSFPVPRKLDAGMVGLGIWHLDEGREPVVVQDLRLEPRLAAGRAIGEIGELRDAPPEPLDVIAPLWYRVEPSPGSLRILGEPDPALSHLAAFRGASLWPVVSLSGLAAGASLTALAAEIERVARVPGTDGLFLDLRRTVPGAGSLDAGEIGSLLRSVSVPLGIISDHDLSELVNASAGKLAWIAVQDGAVPPREIPPERILILKEKGQ